MKRNEIVEKLIKEGFSEKTLVRFTDGQLNSLAERILGEQNVDQSVNIPKTDVAAIQKAKNEKRQFVTYEGENPYDENDDTTDAHPTGSSDWKKKKKKEVKETSPNSATTKVAFTTNTNGFSKPNKVKETETEVNELMDKEFWRAVKKVKPRTEDNGNWKKHYTSKTKKETSSTPGSTKVALTTGNGFGGGQLNEYDSRLITTRNLENELRIAGVTDFKNKSLEELGEEFYNEPGVGEAFEFYKKVRNAADRREIQEWVQELAEEKFHPFTSKNDIMDLIKVKLNEDEGHNFGPKVNKGHNGIPEFMTYDAIKDSATKTAPAPVKTPTIAPSKPKRHSPYQPGPGPNPKPKAGLGEEELPEGEVSKEYGWDQKKGLTQKEKPVIKGKNEPKQGERITGNMITKRVSTPTSNPFVKGKNEPKKGDKPKTENK